MKNILLQFTELYNMTCVYCREEDKLFVCIKTTPSCIQKKKLKLCFCVWTRMTWLRISESFFTSKILSHKSWKTAHSSNIKYFATMPLWPSSDLSTMLCHYSFLVQCLLSTCKLLAFLESIWSVFNSKAASRVPLTIFIALMVSRAWPW